MNRANVEKLRAEEILDSTRILACSSSLESSASWYCPEQEGHMDDM